MWKSLSISFLLTIAWSVGTLTENSLQFLGAVCCGATLDGKSGDKDALEDFTADDGQPLPVVCQQVMATCHSLTVLGAGEGTPNGDPLEVELLIASRWTLRTSTQTSGQLIAAPPSNVTSVGQCVIVKHFEFTPDRLRAATLLRDDKGKLRYLLKGSPEVIVRMSSQATVPKDIQRELSNLARKGYRVISMAYRDCPESEDQLCAMTQDELEALGDIKFAGMLYLSSSLKEDTTRTIQTLKHARIHTNMITGDHIHTAIAIGGQCKLVHNHELSSDNLHRKRNSTRSVEPAVHMLYIIDEDEQTGHVSVIDHATDEPVQLSLPEVLSLAAQSLFRSVSKRRTDRQSLFSFTTTKSEALQHQQPVRSVDSVENPLFHQQQQNPSEPRPLPPLEAAVSEPSILRQPIVELAITGKGLQALKRNYGSGMVRAVVRFAKIFARMKPYDKKFVVETLLEMKEFEPLDLSDNFHGSFAHGQTPISSAGFNPWKSVERFLRTYTSINLGKRELSPDDTAATLATINKFEVLFCGDGANDMIALRAATVGVSLCDAETSVAAPITSKQQTPAAVIEVLKQGRCSLITAYVLILFNIMYGIIQLFMACELYSYGLKAGDYMYLIQDLFYTLVLGLAISYSEPSSSLSFTLPPQRFLSPYFLTKLFSQLITFIAFQAIALGALSKQGFYDRYETDDPLTSAYAQESAVANNMALAQLMIASIVSSIGEPFRVIWVKNIYHWVALACQFVWLMAQVFVQDSYFFKHSLEIHPVPIEFGFILVVLMFVNLCVCVGLNALVDHLFLAKANERWFEKITRQMILDAYQIAPSRTHVSITAPSAPVSVADTTPSWTARRSDIAPNNDNDVFLDSSPSKIDRRPLLK